MKPRWIWLLVLGVVVTACAPSGPSRSGPDARESAQPRAPKLLTIALKEEPTNLIIALGSAGSGTDIRLAVHHRLSTYDDRGGLHPMLAAELPSREKGTWTVRADGTMQTTYRLRPNVTWHDGAPLRAEDVVFAWTVTRDPEIPTTQRSVSSLIERIDAPDDATLIMEWKGSYPFANAIVTDDLGPMPVHILATMYQTDKDRFVQSPYWTREFVGVGPYQLAEWEPGSHVVLRAYDAFYGGRAKIDTLIVRFIEDDNAVTTAMLSGAVDGEIPAALQFEQAIFVQRQLEQAGRKPLVVIQPEKWRHWFIQFREARPTELGDVRVRRALLHAIDREALVAALLEGRVPIADSFIPPNDPKYEWVKDVSVGYPYDPRRAVQLLAEVGWTQRADGALVTSAGSPVTIPARTESGRQDEQELAIVADMWKTIGLQVDQHVLTPAEQRNLQFRASFPGVYAKEIPVTFSNVVGRLYGPGCPTEQTRWVGSSLGCYQNAQMDRAVDGLRVAIDPAQQRELYRELIAVQTRELPVLSLFFNANVTVFREGVTGPTGGTVPRTNATWNVAEWDVN